MWEKLKPYIADDAVFYSLLIISIALAAFGLGRYSESGQVLSNQPAQIIFSERSRSDTELDLQEDTAANQALGITGGEPETSNNLNEQDSGKFVGSKNSDKYHLPWCSGAKRIKEENQVWFANEAEARSKGYMPAGNCPGL
ncbi:hypothetical protein N9L26_01325 [Candidatus Pacebacteria bacterium]|nr:hypothetical protein [Candidatus Paceibacterota bacterium]